jgi:hypothetical protein
MPGPIGTVRPYAKTNRPTLAADDRLLSDNPATGVGATRFADLLAQLNGLYQQLTGRNAPLGYAGVAADGFLDPAIMRAALAPEEVADDAAKNALTVVAGDVGRRLVRVTASGINYLAKAAGTGADKWQVYNNAPSATEALQGILEIATQIEALAGTDDARAITALKLRAVLDSYVLPADAYRAPEPWLYSDGVSGNRAAGVFALGTRGNIAGVPTASWVGWVDVPTANPASSAWASSIQSNTSGFFPANNMGISFASNGALLVNADAGGGNYRNYQWLGFRAAYSGQRIWLEVRFTQGTSNPVIRVNGIDISSTFIVVIGGTPPPWLASSLVATYCLNGFNWVAGRAPRGCWINAHLTDAESDDWRLRGVIPAWVRSGGSVKLAVNSDFSAGSDGWSPANGTVTGNVDSIGGVDDTLEISAAGGTSAACVVGHGLFVRAGDKARVRFDIYRPSSNTVGTWIGLRNSGSALSDQAVQPVADTWTSYDVVMTWPQTNDPGLQFRLAVSPSSGGTLGTADKFYLKNVKVSPLGALTLPEVTPDNILRDASLMSPPIDGYTVGCTPQIGAADGWIRGGGSGAGYVMADTVLLGTGRSIAEIWMYSVSGGTASLGESSGSTATLAASTSLTAGVWTKVTPLKAISSTGKLYRGLGTATDSYVAVRTMPRGTQP